MTNDKLADEIPAWVVEEPAKRFVPWLLESLANEVLGNPIVKADAAKALAALRSERPQSGEMVMPCSITVGAARFGVGVKVETVQAAINRAFVRLQNAEHIEGKLRELLVGTLPFFELLEKIRLAAAEAERGKT